MVTLKDIARKCGLSTATVSKALNGMPDVSLATAEYVRSVARDMGYQAAEIMLTNRQRGAQRVALLAYTGPVNFLGHQYIANVTGAVYALLDREGYEVFVMSRKPLIRAESYADYLSAEGFEGVVVIGEQQEVATLDELARTELPFVSVDRVFQERSCVLSDNRQGLRDLTEHALSMGHRRIAYIHGEETSVTRERIDGYMYALSRAGVPFDEALLVPSHYNDPLCVERATHALMDLADPPTCILCPDDMSALGSLRAFYDRRMRVPDDISVAGYDGGLIAEAAAPRLTTIRQDIDHIARMAVELLIRAMSDQPKQAARRVSIPGKLSIGDSVGRPTAR